MTDEWILTLPYRTPPLSLNARHGHWSQQRKLEDNVQKAAWALAKQHRMPRLNAVTAELVWYPGSNRRYDADNIAPTLKPAIDGLVHAGVLPDDNSTRVIATSQRVVLRRDDPYDSGTGRVLLVIRDASVFAPQGG